LKLNGAALTVGSAVAIATGTVSLAGAGAILTSTGAATISTGTITGVGKIASAVTASGAAHITANGGLLEVTGAITGGTVALLVTGAGDTLQLDAAGNAVSSLSFNASTGTLKLNGNTATLTISTAATIGAGNVLLAGTGATLTDAAGLTLAGGTISGTGSLAANTAVSGSGTIAVGVSTAGTITASGGVLDLTGAVSGRTLSIANVAGSTLKIDSTTSTSAAIALTTTNETLEIGNGTFTDSALETVAGGTLKVDGSSSILNLGAGLTVSSGTFTQSGGTVAVTGTATFSGGTDSLSNGSFSTTANVSIASGVTLTAGGEVLSSTGGLAIAGVLRGTGKSTGVVSGAGTVIASGGVLELVSNVTSTSTTFDIDSVNGSVLKVDGTTASNVTFTFLGGTGILELADVSGGMLQGFSGRIAGLTVSSTSTPTNDIDIPVAAATDALISGSTLTVLNGATTVATIALSSAPAAGVYGHVQTDSVLGGYDIFLSNVPCFCLGTRIATLRGDIAVEDLVAGDWVLTARDQQSEPRPVVWIGRRSIDLTRHANPHQAMPIRICANAIAAGQPRRDLLVSPEHALYLDGMLIPARLLVNGGSIVQETSCRAVTYYHVELDCHDILVAEGLAAESYLDTGNRGMFENANAPLVLHPDFSDDQMARTTGCCARFIDDPVEVKPIWQSLAARAREAGWRLPDDRVLIDDPDLHVMVGDRRFDAVHMANGRYVFVVSSNGQPIRIASRTVRPHDIRPWVSDDRLLGVLIRRLRLRFDETVAGVALDSPFLHAGWWQIEHHGGWPCRWTNGNAILPVIDEARSALVIEVELAGRQQYPKPADQFAESDVERRRRPAL
jgi:Hint domain